MRQCSAFKTHYYMILFPQHIGIIAIFAPFSAFCALYCAHPPGLYMEETGGGCVESRHERVRPSTPSQASSMATPSVISDSLNFWPWLVPLITSGLP